MKYRISSLFPTPVGEYKMSRAFSKEELAYTLGLDLYPNMSNKTSKNTHIFDSPQLGEIRQFCQEATDHFVQEVYRPLRSDLKIEITQSWANVTEAGQYHHQHNHPNSLVSGVLYVQTQDDDSITFVNLGYPQLQIATRDYAEFNSVSWSFPARQGHLILFPSGLTHVVSPLAATRVQSRISISFNTFPRGELSIDGFFNNVRV